MGEIESYLSGNYPLVTKRYVTVVEKRTRWCFVDFNRLEIKQVVNDSLEKTDRTGVRFSPAPLKKVRNKNLNDIYNKHIGKI